MYYVGSNAQCFLHLIVIITYIAKSILCRLEKADRSATKPRTQAIQNENVNLSGVGTDNSQDELTGLDDTQLGESSQESDAAGPAYQRNNDGVFPGTEIYEL